VHLSTARRLPSGRSFVAPCVVCGARQNRSLSSDESTCQQIHGFPNMPDRQPPRLLPQHNRPETVNCRGAVVVLRLRTILRYRIGCLPPPKQHACGWLEGRFGQRSRQTVGIAWERQKAVHPPQYCYGGREGRMKKKEGGREKSEGRGQSSTGPRGSEGAQNMWRAAVREAGRPCTPGGGPANHQ
jgi:hypothetical protein